MNTMIDLHDSTVEAITKNSGEVRVYFKPAYLHKSEGQPGIDVGTGWVQDAYLHFTEASIVGNPPGLPCWVGDGELLVGAKRFMNLIPVSLESDGHVQLKLTFITAHTITISGQGARLELHGEPKYVEEFRPR